MAKKEFKLSKQAPHCDECDEQETVSMVRVLSLRPGNIITKSGTLSFNQILEMPSDEAFALVEMYPNFLRVI